MRIARQMLYEEIEDYDAYDFYLMKKSCACEKTFTTIGVIKGPKGSEILKSFKQTIPIKNIPLKQNVILYTEE